MRKRAGKPAAAPDLFVVGGARCGSTTIHHYLDQHPGIFMCKPDKEPSYYCDIYGVEDPEVYFSNFSGARPGQLRGDASTPYLTCPASPGLIHEANPEAKILISLRQPAERAYSLYLKMCSLGHETSPSFEEALERERDLLRNPSDRRRAGYYYNYLYFHSGLYAEQLRRYFDRFPPGNIHVLLFDDLKSDPQAVFRRIAAWLGLPGMEDGEPEARNRSTYPRSLGVQHWTKHRLDPLLRRLRFPCRGRLVAGLLELNTAGNRPPGPDEALLRKLTEDYAEDIRETASLIGRDLGRWLK